MTTNAIYDPPLHLFGIRPNRSALWWGARAIYKGGDDIDLLHDRQQMNGGTPEERTALSAWINAVGLPGIKAKLKVQRIGTRDRGPIRFEDAAYTLVADPRGSCGYLYLGAAPVGSAKETL